jgi:hypothetical protein
VFVSKGSIEIYDNVTLIALYFEFTDLMTAARMIENEIRSGFIESQIIHILSVERHECCH